MASRARARYSQRSGRLDTPCKGVPRSQEGRTKVLLSTVPGVCVAHASARVPPQGTDHRYPRAVPLATLGSTTEGATARLHDPPPPRPSLYRPFGRERVAGHARARVLRVALMPDFAHACAFCGAPKALGKGWCSWYVRPTCGAPACVRAAGNASQRARRADAKRRGLCTDCCVRPVWRGGKCRRHYLAARVRAVRWTHGKAERARLALLTVDAAGDRVDALRAPVAPPRRRSVWSKPAEEIVET
jgi:hypothetical protein